MESESETEDGNQTASQCCYGQLIRSALCIKTVLKDAKRMCPYGFGLLHLESADSLHSRLGAPGVSNRIGLGTVRTCIGGADFRICLGAKPATVSLDAAPAGCFQLVVVGGLPHRAA